MGPQKEYILFVLALLFVLTELVWNNLARNFGQSSHTRDKNIYRIGFQTANILQKPFQNEIVFSSTHSALSQFQLECSSALNLFRTFSRISNEMHQTVWYQWRFNNNLKVVTKENVEFHLKLSSLMTQHSMN